ncbi:EamA family transporter [uncultured Desulfuromusa sp.]|uniref:DMT family transporter n=1 Tax=uncultured Desulfuromusa sp. TaxID=219183 RepID=UPI002AA771E1|nr:EamA family transporter [uncultured Desulfuromusa sp.]
MKTVNTKMGALEWLLLLILSVLWGGSFFFVGVAVKALPPLIIVTLRVSLAAIALNLIVRATGLRMPTEWHYWKAFFGMGLLNNVIPFCLIVWGQTHIASGLASIFNATTPLFTVLVAHAFTKDEKISVGRMGGILIGFTGVAVIIGLDSLGGLGTDTLAQLAVLSAALSYAFAGVYGRRFKSMGTAPLVTASGQVTASTILLTPLALFVDQPWSLAMPGLEVWVAISGLALVSTALAYIIYFHILATAGATNLLLVTFLIPVSAILLGAVFLNEQVVGKDLAGMGLIGCGLVAIDGRCFSFLKRKILPTGAVS